MAAFGYSRTAHLAADQSKCSQVKLGHLPLRRQASRNCLAASATRGKEGRLDGSHLVQHRPLGPADARGEQFRWRIVVETVHYRSRFIVAPATMALFTSKLALTCNSLVGFGDALDPVIELAVSFRKPLDDCVCAACRAVAQCAHSERDSLAKSELVICH